MRRALSVVVLASCAAAFAASSAGASPALADRTCRLGAVYVISGHTGTMAQSKAHLAGTVMLRGQWGSGHWHVIDFGYAGSATGAYRLVIRPAHRGRLHLRLLTPDNITYRVTLTVI